MMTNNNELWPKIKLMEYGDTRFHKDSRDMVIYIVLEAMLSQSTKLH